MLLIPSQTEQDLELVTLSPTHKDRALMPEDELQLELYPIILRDASASRPGDESTGHLQIQSTLLLRPTQDRPGLVAYHLPDTTLGPNRRTTCLAMTCGLFRCRFYGNVLVDFRCAPGLSSSCGNMEFLLQALHSLAVAGIVTSPDHRQWQPNADLHDNVSWQKVRSWILCAAHENYHDQETIQRWTQITSQNKDADRISSDNDENDSDDDTHKQAVRAVSPVEFVTKQPLCLHCRRPTQALCEKCNGAYFCDPPRDCRIQGWSHDCLCSTWKAYVDQGEILSTFPFADNWYAPLVARGCQISNQPYEDDFLTKTLGVSENDASSWWATERHGWSGGESSSARQIDPERRVTYAQGFAPLSPNQFPSESIVCQSTWKQLHDELGWGMNEVGLYRLRSWLDYYKLRNLPDSSPAALLLTFPLTLYYALVEYGTVPWTVSRMLDKPLRIDIVGAEKELGFLDLFQEVAFLLGNQVVDHDASSPLLELVFVVRKDMLPLSLVGRRNDGTYGLDLNISRLLRIRIVEGTYGDSVNPDLDCGSRIGPPGMIMGFNAGLYAYDSWRSVLKYLKSNQNIVGVFSDYNEWSGLQCARLGGNCETLRMNPFRQPRAMPVYSMNIPQFCNGFLYAINPQELV